MIYGNISNCKVYNGQTRSEYQCRLGYEVLSEDTAKNQRRVKLQLEVRSISSNYSTYGYNQTSIIDGYQLAAASFDTRNTNAWQIFGTREITIDGAFYGTKTASFTTNANSSWLLKSGSASVDINLDNLHTPPVITSVSMVEKNTLLENAVQIVQHLSVKNITIETTTYDDATISSYQVHHNGVLIGSSTSNGMTIDFNNVGTLATFEMNGKMYCTLKFVVIDSFGTSSFIETQFEVIQYVKPNLIQTSSNVKRNGQLTGKVKLNLVGTFYNNKVNDIQNTMRLEFAYWKKGENESNAYYEIPYEAIDDNVSLWNWNVAINGKEITDVSKDNAYIFSVRLIDYFNQGDQVLLLCPVGEYVWAEFKNRVDFKNITIQGKDISEHLKIIESGSNSNGSYIKYEDGTMFCRGIVSGTSTLSAYWDIFKRTAENLPITFPVPFVDIPDVNLTPNYKDHSFIAIPYDVQSSGLTFTCIKAKGTTNTNYRVSYIAMGKWK